MTRTVVSLLFVAALGCGGPPATPVSRGGSSADKPQIDLAGIREDLRRPFADFDHLRTVLAQLNGGEKSPPLDPAASAALRERLRLTDADIAAIGANDFGPLDAALLEQSMFFRDVARTLDAMALPAVDRALAALSWTVRHVPLEARPGLPDPPMQVAWRGRGTPLERLVVFATLCHALGLEPFAVGGPDAASGPAKLWGVAVIDGPDLRLFDPRLGVALPAVGGSGVATLGSLAKDAESLAPLISLGYDVTADRIREARLYPVMAWVGLAPRWARVDPLLPPGTRVGTDARQLLEQADRLPLSGYDPGIPGTPPRVLAEFLPESAGGTDRPVVGQPRRSDLFAAGLIPWDQLPRAVLELPGPLGNQLRLNFATIAGYDRQPGLAERIRRQQNVMDTARMMLSQEKESPTDPRLQQDILRMIQAGSRDTGSDVAGPTLRQMLLQGQFSQATEAIVALRTQLQSVRNRGSQQGQIEFVNQWAEKARDLFTRGATAQRAGDAQALEKLEGEARHLDKDLPRVVGYVQWLAAGLALTRLDLLTATSKHDQSEAKSRRAADSATWQSTIQAWRAFIANHPDSPEAVPARRHLAAALAASGDKKTAADIYRQVARTAIHPYDRLAASWLAGVP